MINVNGIEALVHFKVRTLNLSCYGTMESDGKKHIAINARKSANLTPVFFFFSVLRRIFI